MSRVIRGKNKGTKWSPFILVPVDGKEVQKASGAVAHAVGEPPLVVGMVAYLSKGDTYTNGTYTVVKRREDREGYPAPLVHLSIRRCDRQPIRDWTHLQRIKDELVGEQYEAVELFPCKARLVQGLNQYHLWIFLDTKFRWPFGFTEPLEVEPNLNPR